MKKIQPEVDDKNPDALCMLGDLELKNDDWVKAKDTLRAAKDASNEKDSYATLCLVRHFRTRQLHDCHII